MNKTTNKKTKLNKTKRKLLITNPDYFYKYFKNTHYIPKSSILIYMKDNYKKYSRLREKEGKYSLGLDECFKFKEQIQKEGNKLDIKTSALGNINKMPLHKFISYIFYATMSSAFIKDKKFTTNEKFNEILKYQMGKDLERQKTSINDKIYDQEYFMKFNSEKYLVADDFYGILINVFSKVDSEINYNTINIIMLLMCQNVFNFIGDLITIKINDLLKPENSSIYRAKKTSKITILKNKQTMDFDFESQLIISKNGNLDPEYPCGTLSYMFSVDLLNNTYSLPKFNLSYDLDKCGPEEQNMDNGQQNGEGEGEQNKKPYLNPAYAIPAGIGLAGVVATPFLLGALGGSQKIKSNKTKKLRKKKNYRY